MDYDDADLFSAQLPNLGVRMQLDWDAENRLVRVAPESGREQTGDLKVEFEYDYRNRRVARRVYTWDGAEWDLTAGRKYVWDGWRLLLELDAGGETLMVLRAYTWGLDLAGQAGGPGGAGILPARPTAAGLLEGAGTIGGLLAVYDTYGTTSTGDDVRYVYLYDGHGNVGQLIDPVPGTYSTALFKARYEYDPYGTVVQKSGAYALGNRNPFQFSTKQFDAETGMGYWGERYYLPDVGRWANRDPIEEKGGANLYEYGRNDPAALTDATGRDVTGCTYGCGADRKDDPFYCLCIYKCRMATFVARLGDCIKESGLGQRELLCLLGCSTGCGTLNDHSRSCNGSGCAA